MAIEGDAPVHFDEKTAARIRSLGERMKIPEAELMVEAGPLLILERLLDRVEALEAEARGR